MSEVNENSKKSFKDTLNLPKTDFPIRPNSKVDDVNILKRWESEDIYKKTFEQNKGSQKFILHDGPPYANGNIHLGHAYNKILKDIICKYKRMAGFNVPVTPGWDCHGLPIELKVFKEGHFNNRLELMRACRNYAQEWIDIQKEEMKALGVLMDFAHPYITMSPSYEAAVVGAFGTIMEKGYIERKNKTVPWCPTDQTVLAAAEIEYENKKDPSVYALFELSNASKTKLFANTKEPIYFLVWTTTPWTLPLNRALMMHESQDYALIESEGKNLIIGKLAAEKLFKNIEKNYKIISTFASKDLHGAKALHPFVKHLEVPIVFDPSVDFEDGTAIVHLAPGCGPIDYEIGIKNGLEIFSPITPDELYAKGIMPENLEGMKVADGQFEVIKILAAADKLFYKANINHSYPHCWRCHNPLIFRATKQWFFDLNAHGLRQKALEIIDTIEFIPPQGKNFLKATVSNRWEWCLSRQRSWGVPIPALICKLCDYTYTNAEFVRKVAQGIEQHGIEYWETVQISDIVSNLNCPKCNSSEFKKEHDILDVWFDAGMSHWAVLFENPDLSYPADLYLEGVDQHRGYFQSSLLTSLALEGQASMKAIMTHGYTVDEKGRKMSKSLGNVVAPQDIIAKVGTDGLRLWVASIGYDSDPVVSEKLLQNVAEVYRKIRNTSRFLLSNLYDFDIQKDAVELDNLTPLDKYALATLYYTQARILAFYNGCDFTGVFHGLTDYCTTELSSFYLDIVKDRLYVEKSNGILRRSTQTVLWHILDALTKLSAPIMSFNAEIISDFYQNNKQASIHLQKFSDAEFAKLAAQNELGQPLLLDVPFYEIDNIESTLTSILRQDAYIAWDQSWGQLKELRSIILKAIESLREQGIVGHSLDCRVKLFIDLQNPEFDHLGKIFEKVKSSNYDLANFLKEILIVSQLELAHDGNYLTMISDGVYADISKAIGKKCPRCWQYDEFPQEDDLCRRCFSILKK